MRVPACRSSGKPNISEALWNDLDHLPPARHYFVVRPDLAMDAMQRMLRTAAVEQEKEIAEHERRQEARQERLRMLRERHLLRNAEQAKLGLRGGGTGRAEGHYTSLAQKALLGSTSSRCDAAPLTRSTPKLPQAPLAGAEDVSALARNASSHSIGQSIGQSRQGGEMKRSSSSRTANSRPRALTQPLRAVASQSELPAAARPGTASEAPQMRKSGSFGSGSCGSLRPSVLHRQDSLVGPHSQRASEASAMGAELLELFGETPYKEVLGVVNTEPYVEHKERLCTLLRSPSARFEGMQGLLLPRYPLKQRWPTRELSCSDSLPSHAASPARTPASTSKVTTPQRSGQRRMSQQRRILPRHLGPSGFSLYPPGPPSPNSLARAAFALEGVA